MPMTLRSILGESRGNSGLFDQVNVSDTVINMLTV